LTDYEIDSNDTSYYSPISKDEPNNSSKLLVLPKSDASFMANNVSSEFAEFIKPAGFHF
jgi:hypothetical protein